MAAIVRGNASLLWLLILWSFLVFCPSTSTSNNENLAISNLQKYIQIRTDQPNPDYASAVDFLQRLATDNGLEVCMNIHHPIYVILYIVKSIGTRTWQTHILGLGAGIEPKFIHHSSQLSYGCGPCRDSRLDNGCFCWDSGKR